MEDSSKLNDWWSSDATERFWLVNERDAEQQEWAVGEAGWIIDAELEADGSPTVFGALAERINVGDILLHYWSQKRAIVGWSEFTSEARPAALPSDEGPNDDNDGWIDAVTADFRWCRSLRKPVTLKGLRSADSEIRSLRDDLVSVHGEPIYFPWSFTGKQQQLKPAQEYLTKLPAAVVTILEQLGGFTIEETT